MQKQLCWRIVDKAVTKNLRSTYNFTCIVNEKLLQSSAVEKALRNNKDL